MNFETAVIKGDAVDNSQDKRHTAWRLQEVLSAHVLLHKEHIFSAHIQIVYK